MKNFTKYFNYCLILITCMLTANTTSFAQIRVLSKMSGRFVVITDNAVHYRVQIQLQVDSANKNLGASTFQFSFNSTNLSFHSGGSPGTSGTDFVAAANFGNTANYNSLPHVTQPTTGNIDIVYDYSSTRNASESGAGNPPNGHNATEISNTTWTPIIDIIFTTLVPGGTSDLTWTNQLNGPGNDSLTNVFDDVIDPTDPTATNYLHYDIGTFSDLASPLPISLINFSAIIEQGVAKINWSTASEINNAYFTIERSTDGKEFVELFNRDGADNSQVKINYVAYDEAPLPGTSYYRLKQTDFNGASKTFNMVSVFNPVAGEFNISSVSPTNFGDNTTLYYKMPAEAAARLVITDLRGRIVREEQIASSGGDNKYELDNTTGWSPGMYIATMYYDGRSSYIKMVKN